MVEILLSLLFLIAAVSFTLRPLVVTHDPTIDGLFVTLAGTMLTLLFLLNFIWQLRSQSVKGLTAIQDIRLKCLRAFRPVWSKGGTDMKTVPPRISVPLVMGPVLLLILVFPGSLDASVSLSHSTASPRSVHPPMLPLALGHHVTAPKRVHDSGLLMDADVRLRAAAALSSNPAIERVAAHARVPLRMIVITANPLLDA